ncbi:unnamed protein product [Pipistrellus nathusii]|uniref:Uncharacterized protein n=1 Tax=Pipistrellus nathusii TaxID=59473 RepID=A0ABP0A2J6_PIPNA
MLSVFLPLLHVWFIADTPSWFSARISHMDIHLPVPITYQFLWEKVLLADMAKRMRNNVLETLKQFIKLLYTRLTISTPPPNTNLVAAPKPQPLSHLRNGRTKESPAAPQPPGPEPLCL